MAHSPPTDLNRNSGAHGDISTAGFTSGMLDELVSIFQTVRGYEAWQANGKWRMGEPTLVVIGARNRSTIPSIADRKRRSWSGGFPYIPTKPILLCDTQ